MMVRGARPKPASLKVLAGNPGKRKVRESVMLPAASPREPAWLEFLPGVDDGEQRETASSWWVTHVPVLDASGLLAITDASVLVDAALCWARIVQCERRVSADGPVMLVARRGRDGATWSDPVRHPLSVTLREYRAAYGRYMDALGLAPLSRSRLPAPGAGSDGDDIFD